MSKKSKQNKKSKLNFWIFYATELKGSTGDKRKALNIYIVWTSFPQHPWTKRDYIYHVRFDVCGHTRSDLWFRYLVRFLLRLVLIEKLSLRVGDLTPSEHAEKDKPIRRCD